MPNSSLRALVRRLAQQELDWQGRHLLAPVVAPGRATVRLQGLVYQFVIRPADHRGFGVFRLDRGGFADWVRDASVPERDHYLRLWPHRQLRLLKECEPGIWLAHPAYSQGKAEGPPLVVHEVARGSAFELIESAYDGSHYWYCSAVLNTRLRLADDLSTALRNQVPPDQLRVPGMTPQDRAAYARLWVPPEPAHGPALAWGSSQDGERLRGALARGGGVLHGYTQDDENFQVSWQDSQGERRWSCVRRHDLTVVSAGICLSDRDSDFDLTSLVGVVEEDR